MFSQYQFEIYKSKKSEDNVELTFSDSLDVESNTIKQEAVFWVRDMINTPSIDKTPEFFIDEIKNLNTDINLQIHDQDWLEKNNFGAVLGVAKGSERSPYLVVGEYNKKADIQLSLIHISEPTRPY